MAETWRRPTKKCKTKKLSGLIITQSDRFLISRVLAFSFHSLLVSHVQFNYRPASITFSHSVSYLSSALSVSYDWPSLANTALYGEVGALTDPCGGSRAAATTNHYRLAQHWTTDLSRCGRRRCCLSWPCARLEVPEVPEVPVASTPGCCCSSPTVPCRRQPSDLSSASHLKLKIFQSLQHFYQWEKDFYVSSRQTVGLLCCWQLKVISVIFTAVGVVILSSVRNCQLLLNGTWGRSSVMLSIMKIKPHLTPGWDVAGEFFFGKYKIPKTATVKIVA